MNENTNKKSAQAEREEAVFKFWQERNIFEKTVAKKSPKGDFIFFEGPPTANAKPALHHLEARAFKDVIPRYKTMQGFRVPRRAGWDTHGLPVELQIEKKLGFTSKKDIEEYGIAKFNTECRDSVFEYIGDWEKFTDRMGYWVDKSKAYYTFDPKYIESLWSIVKKVDDQGLLYKDYRVVPWCPRCGTSLATHELAQGYQDVKDLSVYVKFKIKSKLPFDDGNKYDAYFLAWTTTPWTLPGNVALAVNSNEKYVFAKINDEIIIVADKLKKVLGENLEILTTFEGDQLVGMEYEPLYPYMSDLNTSDKKMANAFKVYAADFVTTEDGTGIVHTAVMYGADDFALGTKVGLPKFHLVDDTGHFIKGTGALAGMPAKDREDNGLKTSIEVLKYLQENGNFFAKEQYVHSYPHCWRCKTPLIYYARDSWYIAMSKLRGELIAENEKINWEPEHIKEGRFGEWVREVKDWAISRERYWGTPLPVWVADDGEKMIVDSFETLKKYTKSSGNTYYVMRHGETDANLKGLITDDPGEHAALTEAGKLVTTDTANRLKDETDIDVIFSSPFSRTKSTAYEVAEHFDLKVADVIEDDRLVEMHLGPLYDNKTWNEYHADFPKTVENFTKGPEGGESYGDVRKRMLEFLFEIEQKYQNKKILIVTHGAPSWLVTAGAEGKNISDTLEDIINVPDYHYLQNAEYRKLDFVPFPHDENFALDPHRPYIDEVVLEKDGKEFRRVKEVMDVWFDSGSMPFAQDHYPFENMDWIDGAGYPGDFISEAIDQTRGWFYTLLAVGVLMGKGTPYKNVISLGHLLDKDGKKMSKSIGNIVDPWEQIEKYGVDVLRLWMFSVNQPGEGKNYDEAVVRELASKTLGLLYNVLAFYELYREHALEIDAEKKSAKSDNVLDTWILARLEQTITISTDALDNYRMLEPVRAIRDFIGDLSTWYLRRSRDRLRGAGVGENAAEDSVSAKQTLYVVMKKLAQLLAPFAPFAAEDIWQKLRLTDDVESVHLSEWPEVHGGGIFAGLRGSDDTALSDMARARSMVEKALAARQENKISVRQPLSKLSISEDLSVGYIEIMKDELNIKEISIDDKVPKGEVLLETEITPELRAEGNVRELMRALQDMRKNAGLTPSDTITLAVQTNEEGIMLLEKFADDIRKTVLVQRINFSENDGEEITIGENVFKVKIGK